MEGGSIALSPGQRKRLLALYRKEPDPLVRLRAHIVLLLADGHAWSVICAVLFCSTATIGRWKARFERSNELRANVDLADADGMHPERMPVGDGLLEFRIVSAKTLGEASLPIAAAQHAREIIRRGQHETDAEENVVKKTHAAV